MKSCFVKLCATTLCIQPCLSVITNGKQKVEARSVLESHRLHISPNDLGGLISVWPELLCYWKNVQSALMKTIGHRSYMDWLNATHKSTSCQNAKIFFVCAGNNCIPDVLYTFQTLYLVLCTENSWQHIL